MEKKISGIKKGFVINSEMNLIKILSYFNKKKVPVLIQEIIKSSDRDNAKFCIFIKHNLKQIFLLSKVHQYPINFGIGSCVVGIHNNELKLLGEKLFESMDYEGIASVEFKYDEIDKCFKMVEINTRYWQQNYLSYISGVNFPLIDYAVSTGQKYSPVESYEIDENG